MVCNSALKQKYCLSLYYCCVGYDCQSDSLLETGVIVRWRASSPSPAGLHLALVPRSMLNFKYITIIFPHFTALFFLHEQIIYTKVLSNRGNIDLHKE